MHNNVCHCSQNKRKKNCFNSDGLARIYFFHHVIFFPVAGMGSRSTIDLAAADGRLPTISNYWKAWDRYARPTMIVIRFASSFRALLGSQLEKPPDLQSSKFRNWCWLHFAFSCILMFNFVLKPNTKTNSFRRSYGS